MKIDKKNAQNFLKNQASLTLMLPGWNTAKRNKLESVKVRGSKKHGLICDIATISVISIILLHTFILNSSDNFLRFYLLFNHYASIDWVAFFIDSLWEKRKWKMDKKENKREWSEVLIESAKKSERTRMNYRWVLYAVWNEIKNYTEILVLGV